MNVLYCFDNKFWMYAAISIYSLLHSKKDSTQITIYCMVPPRTSRRVRKKILKIVEQFSGCKMVWRVVHSNENPFANLFFSRWSPVIFYRLIAHRIFPDLERLLYLDSDTLICDDLTEMYNTDLGNNVMGAVVDCAIVDDLNHKMGQYVRDFQEKYIPGGFYVNSGVLLIDTTRKDVLDSLTKTTNTDDLSCPDQDMINKEFHDKILYLPLRYNFTYSYYYPTLYADQISETSENYAIYHFYTRKPYALEPRHKKLQLKFLEMCKPMGWDIEDFINNELKHRSRKTCIPGIYISGEHIKCLGITVG